MIKNNFSLIGLVRMRDAKIHMSSFMLLRIVDDLQVKTKSAYIGEIHGHYQTARSPIKMIRKIGGTKCADYTYGGVASQLRKLYNQGLLRRGKDGQFVNYSLTKKGVDLLDSLYV
ncbi:hypothetical protein VPHD518_0055 [Vibrio phage D518]